MAKRQWKVEWRARSKSDGMERLGQAVKLAIEQGAVVRRTQANQSERPQLALHAGADALEELDA
jgi:hypothetical protein